MFRFRLRLWVIGLTFLLCGLTVHVASAWYVVPAGGGRIEMGQFACCGGAWFIAGQALLFLELAGLSACEDRPAPVGHLWLLWFLGWLVAVVSTVATLPP